MNLLQLSIEVTRVYELARSKFSSYSRECPQIVGFRNSRTAGVARARSNYVEFNLDMAEKNPVEFIDTIIHEIAHLVVMNIYPGAKQSHGPEFRYVCRVLGGSGTTYHDHDGTPPKRVYFKTEYLIRCECRNHWISARQKNKMDAGVKYKCQICNESIPSKVHDVRSR